MLRMVRNLIVIEPPAERTVTYESTASGRVMTPVDLARRRFGQPFAHEPGTNWQPRSTRFLTEWLSKRVAEREAAEAKLKRAKP